MSEDETNGNDKLHSLEVEIKALKTANQALNQVFDSK